MVLGAYVVHGTDTLSASAPSVIARKTVAATGCAAGDVVLIQPISAITEGRDGFGAMTFHTENVTTDAFDIVADRPELKSDVDFDFIVFDSA